jgi:hypothetical protein
MDPMVVRIGCAVLAIAVGALIFKRRRSRDTE